MPKFNEKSSIEGIVESHPDKVENYEGGVSFKTNEKNELYLRVATWLVAEPKFYGDSTDEIIRIRELIFSIGTTDPEFVLKLAAYARNELHLRSAPQFLMVESLANPESKKLVRKWVPYIIKRADELSESIAAFIARNGQVGKMGKGSLPNQFKLGLEDAFHNFTEYDFAKYKMDDKSVKLSDVIRMVHPKPLNPDESALFKRIRTNTMKVPETWEVIISTKGNTKEAWNEVIPKMGYMAKLRNLRNVANSDADLDAVLSHLTNEKAIRGSKQFPFRFFSAWKMMEGVTDPFKAEKIRRALETAMELSIKNIPHVAGNTLISADVSGSMQAPISERSKVERIDISVLMAAMAGGFSDTGISSVFGTEFVIVPRIGKIIADADKMRNTSTNGMSTNGYKVLEYLNENKIKVDRVMIFTDCQLWDSDASQPSSWGRAYEHQSLYKQYLKYKQINPSMKLYLFDLAGYGTVQIPDNEPNVITIGGWSDRVFDFIKIFEENKTKALSIIENYSPIPTSQEQPTLDES